MTQDLLLETGYWTPLEVLRLSSRKNKKVKLTIAG